MKIAFLTTDNREQLKALDAYHSKSVAERHLAIYEELILHKKTSKQA